MRPGRALRAGLLIVAVLCASMSVAQQAAAAPACPDVEVVFARGTDEPAGIGQVGQALVDTLKPMLKGLSIGTYAVKYPASFEFLEAAAGANDMSRRVVSTVANCPDTKLVLGGYSQATPLVYLSFMISVFIGTRLRQTESPLAIGSGISNGGWLRMTAFMITLSA